MPRTERIFRPGDRYEYDFKVCTVAQGWAQVDTGQDASYFGTWANPSELRIVNYCEGDVSVTSCDGPEDFAAELRAIKRWNEEQGHGFSGIDPGLSDELAERFRAVGVGDLLH